MKFISIHAEGKSFPNAPYPKGTELQTKISTRNSEWIFVIYQNLLRGAGI